MDGKPILPGVKDWYDLGREELSRAGIGFDVEQEKGSPADK